MDEFVTLNEWKTFVNDNNEGRRENTQDRR